MYAGIFHAEIAISYWPSLGHIKRWKQNAEHLQAQQQGSARWYKSYKVEVVELLRSYESSYLPLVLV